MSSTNYWFVRSLAELGHSVHVLTNCNETEPSFTVHLTPDDRAWLDLEGVELSTVLPLATSSYIPWAVPHVSRLAGLCLKTLASLDADVIIGSYLEPYGIAAAIAATATKTPLILRHAGSDVGRLALHADLRHTYRWALDCAAGLIAPEMEALRRVFGDGDWPTISSSLPRLPPPFFDCTEPLDLGDYLSKSQEWFSQLNSADDIAPLLDGQRDRIPDDSFAIGLYGKVGVTKGSFDLLAALMRLADDGMAFNFVTMSTGHGEVLRRYYAAIRGHSELRKRTWVMPPAPPWRVPGFLARCNAVAFLERGFPISFHGPAIPREILASKACLVVSGEVAAKRGYDANLANDRNAIVVRDPSDIDLLTEALRSVICDQDRALAIGRQGYHLSKFWESSLPSVRRAAEEIIKNIERQVEPRKAMN